MKNSATIACFLFLSLIGMASAGAKESGLYTEETYCASVAKTLDRELEDPERTVATSTWLFYDAKWKDKWDRSLFDYAVEEGANNCGNKAMLASAKAGNLGKKGLKALVKATGNTAEKFSDWLERKRKDAGKK